MSQDPYIRLPSGARPESLVAAEHVFRDVLIERAHDQAYDLVTAIEGHQLDGLPSVVRSADEASAGAVTRRVSNMLRAFCRFLGDDNQASVREQLGPAFAPLLERKKGELCVTSPALLVVQSILYSHAEWFQEDLHEAHSAQRAYDELMDQGFPELHCRFIAAILAHQTLLRVAWSVDPTKDPPEIMAVRRDGGNVKPMETDEATSRGLARTLYPFLQSSANAAADESLARYLTAALVLHSLCLLCRHHREEDRRLAGIRRQALGFNKLLLDAFQSRRTGEIEERLVYWQRARYLRQARPNDWKDISEGHIRESLGRTTSVLTNLSIALPRVPTKRVWEALKSKNKLKSLRPTGRSPSRAGGPFSIPSLIADTVGLSRKLEIPKLNYLLAALGLDDAIPSKVTAWIRTPPSKGKRRPRSRGKRSASPLEQALGELLSLVREKHVRSSAILNALENHFPAPLVGHVLREMQRCRPEEFGTLRIIPRGVAVSPAHARFAHEPMVIYVPKFSPVKTGEIWDGHFHAAKLVARYIAAMVISMAVTYGPQEIVLDFYEVDLKEDWQPIVDGALNENGRDLMLCYLVQYHSEPCAIRFSDRYDGNAVDLKLPQLNDKPTVVGIDIGGTNTKWESYRATQAPQSGAGGLVLADKVEGGGTFPTKALQFSGGADAGGQADDAEARRQTRDRNAQSLTESLRMFSEKLIEAVPATKAPPVKAVGVAWPGPLHADGTVAATSGILQTVFGLGRSIHENHPEELHRLRIPEALRKALGEGVEAVAINDGLADIIGSHDVIRDIAGQPDDLSVVLKAGTGTACSVYIEGRPVPLLTELGKAVINLLAKRDTKQKPPFQQGDVRLLCSQQTLSEIIKRSESLKGAVPLLQDGDFAKSMGKFITAGVRKPDEGNDSALDETKAQQLNDALEKVQLSTTEARLVDDAIDKLRRNLRRRLAALRIKTLRSFASGKDDATPDATASFKATELSGAQRIAIACAWVAGRYLADVVALVSDLFSCNEVRLAGGPMSAETGLVVAASAEEALKSVYGFDIPEEGRDPDAGGLPLGTGDAPGAVVGYEVRRLRLIYPPHEGGGTGPRGAAAAALDALIRETKQKQLLECRSLAAARMPQREFSALDILEDLKKRIRKPWITEIEIEAMLAREASGLGLTRLRGGTFRKFR